MKWGEILMLLAHYSHTPLPDIWRMTYRQFTYYADAMPEVAKITSPFPTGEKAEESISDPDSIRIFGKTMGLFRSEKTDA